MYGKPAGASFPRTDIRPRPRKSALCDDNVGGDERCAELLETVPNFDELFERKSSEEVRALLDTFLDGDNTDNQIERLNNNSPSNTAAPKSSSDAVEAAFSDLLNG